jgi:putative endonuclease|tara:strand:+ start:174 stop:458 length:285 start_codon:yes stop_codon:yes gene_type:complete
MEKQYWVYILTNRSNKVLYIGCTSNLPLRVAQHKQKAIGGFTAKYNINKLIYFESTNDAYAAVSRERQLKGWTRKKKSWLINRLNPEWVELFVD